MAKALLNTNQFCQCSAAGVIIQPVPAAPSRVPRAMEFWKNIRIRPFAIA
jgi:hypothetical protein